MPDAIRIVDQIQDQSDFQGPLVDGKFIAYDSGISKFILDDITTINITGLTTTGIADGDFVYVSSNNTVSKTDSASITTSRCVGANEGVSGSITAFGVVENAKFTTVGGSPSAGTPVWLAAATDDVSTGAGKLTATVPIVGIVAEIGIVIDNSNYASLKTCKILVQIKKPVVL